MRPFPLSLVLFLCASLAQATEYHLSLDGSDVAGGTVHQPIRTFAHAAALLKPGDTLTVRGGRYTEPLMLKKKYGKADQPITIRAAKGQKVLLDGTDSLDGLQWSQVEGGIYKARLDQPASQLFANDRMMTPARWPDAHMTDDNFFRIKETNRMVVYGNSPLGTITDARPRNNMWTSIREDQLTEHAPVRDDRNLTSLAGLGRTVEGAVAVMNIGSWMNFASRLTSHEAGSASFEYDASFSEAGKEIQRITDDLRQGKRFGHFLPCCTIPIEAECSFGLDSHHPIISLQGIPSSVIVFRILHPILASTLCDANPLARIAGPKMIL